MLSPLQPRPRTKKLPASSDGSLSTPTNLSEEWGLAAIDTPNGVGLAQNDGFPYEPSDILVAAAVSLAEALDTDRYLADTITVAEDLPGVRVRGPRLEQATAALERMRGCVSVQAVPRPEACIASETQSLIAWIAEFASGVDAERVAEAASIAAGDHARITYVRGSVAGVLIARSVQVGTPPLEDQDTIQRLTPAVAAALQHATPDLFR